MELRQMRYFVALAEELHFGRAAARLHISTPTLSQQMKALERRIGAPLLVRDPHGLRLTGTGEVLLRESRRTLRAADEALRETRRAAGLAEPVLRLGQLNGMPPALLARLRGLVAGHDPATRAVLVGGTTADQLRRLGAGEVDLVVLRTPVELPPGSRLAPLADEEIGVLAAEDGPLAGDGEIDPAELSGRELILTPRDLGPGYHDALLARLRAAGGTPVLSDNVMGAAQIPAALALHRDAFSLLSARAAGAPGLAWRPLRGRPLHAGYAAAWRTGNRNPALRALVAALLDAPAER